MDVIQEHVSTRINQVMQDKYLLYMFSLTIFNWQGEPVN